MSTRSRDRPWFRAWGVYHPSLALYSTEPLGFVMTRALARPCDPDRDRWVDFFFDREPVYRGETVFSLTRSVEPQLTSKVR